MDWWGPLYELPIVNNLALLLIPSSFLGATKESVGRWLRLPELWLALFVLIGASMSSFFIWLGGVIFIFQEFGKVILCYAVILLVVRQEKGFRFILWTIFLCAAWMAFNGILQIQTGYGFGDSVPLWRSEYNVFQIRAFGIFNDPNDLCLVFILVLPLLYSEFRVASNAVIKWSAFALMPLMITAVWLTNSRGGIMGIFGMVVGYAILKTKGIKRWISILIPGMIISIFAPSRFSSQQSGVDIGRVDAWGIGLQEFLHHPIFGIGYGYFIEIGGGKVAHNSYVHALTEMGLVGYMPWFILIFITMTHLCRAINFNSSIQRKDQFHLIGLFSALSGYLTSIYFLSRCYNYVLYILLALALSKVAIVADNSGKYEEIFGNKQTDLKKGVIATFISIFIIYGTVRLANLMGGR